MGPKCHGMTGWERGPSPHSLSAVGQDPRQLGLTENLLLAVLCSPGQVPVVTAAQAPPSGFSEGDQKEEDGAQEGEPPGHSPNPQRFQQSGQRSRKTVNRPAFMPAVHAAEI